MNIAPEVTLLGGATITPQDPLRSGSYKIGLAAKTYTLGDADIVYSGTLELEDGEVEQYVLDVYAGEITTPGTARPVTVGFYGLDPDGETIAMDTLYYLGIRSATSSSDAVDVTCVANWSAGPFGLAAGSSAGDGVNVQPGSEVHLVNNGGWTIEAGDELDFSVVSPTGPTVLEIVIIGKKVAAGS